MKNLDETKKRLGEVEFEIRRFERILHDLHKEDVEENTEKETEFYHEHNDEIYALILEKEELIKELE